MLNVTGAARVSSGVPRIEHVSPKPIDKAQHPTPDSVRSSNSINPFNPVKKPTPSIFLFVLRYLRYLLLNAVFLSDVTVQPSFDTADTEILPPCYPIESVTKFELKSNETDGWSEQTGVQYLIRRQPTPSWSWHSWPRQPVKTFHYRDGKPDATPFRVGGAKCFTPG